ncbi:MAG: hypothetical protein Rsou_0966 [Candidatus Ruthia sp. Asou_11_S2]|nr:hypothetical protein [Candidatus Ruthia sp. Asou_11_S2]
MVDKIALDGLLFISSGTWTVPKTGQYEIYGVGAGGSAKFKYTNVSLPYWPSFIEAYGGSGAFKEIVSLAKGQAIAYTVGAGVAGSISVLRLVKVVIQQCYPLQQRVDKMLVVVILLPKEVLAQHQMVVLAVRKV